MIGLDPEVLAEAKSIQATPDDTEEDLYLESQNDEEVSLVNDKVRTLLQASISSEGLDEIESFYDDNEDDTIALDEINEKEIDRVDKALQNYINNITIRNQRG